jgi:hypothetical protein
MLDKKTIQILLRLLEEEELQRQDLAIKENLELINQRLDRIESFIFKNKQQAFSAEAVAEDAASGNYQGFDEYHSSREKFLIVKSLAEENSGNCPLEPASKPCDHCLMCSCRGF